MNNYEKKKI